MTSNYLQSLNVSRGYWAADVFDAKAIYPACTRLNQVGLTHTFSVVFQLIVINT